MTWPPQSPNWNGLRWVEPQSEGKSGAQLHQECEKHSSNLQETKLRTEFLRKEKFLTSLSSVIFYKALQLQEVVLFGWQMTGLHICCNKSKTNILCMHANTVGSLIFPGKQIYNCKSQWDYLLPKRHAVILGRCCSVQGSVVCSQCGEREEKCLMSWNCKKINMSSNRKEYLV